MGAVYLQIFIIFIGFYSLAAAKKNGFSVSLFLNSSVAVVVSEV